MEPQIGQIVHHNFGDAVIAYVYSDSAILEFLEGDMGWPKKHSSHEQQLREYIPVGRDKYWWISGEDLERWLDQTISEVSENYQIY